MLSVPFEKMTGVRLWCLERAATAGGTSGKVERES